MACILQKPYLVHYSPRVGGTVCRFPWLRSCRLRAKESFSLNPSFDLASCSCCISLTATTNQEFNYTPNWNDKSNVITNLTYCNNKRNYSFYLMQQIMRILRNINSRVMTHLTDCKKSKIITNLTYYVITSQSLLHIHLIINKT